MVVRFDDTLLDPCYVGLRMTADEFLALPESPVHYELVDGVVVMSPAASFGHQDIAGEILFQIRSYLEKNPIGRAVTDVDVKLADDLVYRPDVVFLTNEKAGRVEVRVTEPPDLVVEIVSPDSRKRDGIAKREDYEAAGVGEYWIIDAEQNTFRFFVLRGDKFVERAEPSDRYVSSILPGFELDLERVRRLF